jgi:hypothetical protein
MRIVLCAVLGLSLLTSAPAAETAAAPIHQTALGNIFLSSETVSFSIDSKGESVVWTVTDFWNNKVAEGTAQVVDGKATIKPAVKELGYFFVRMQPIKEGKAGPEQYTSFCRISPYEIKDRANSPFGAMTHFAQGMDTDILPLLAKAGITAIRDEHYWGHVEKKKGEFVFSPKSDAYMAAAAQNKIDPLVVMSFANELYDSGQTPHTPEACDAFGRYGQEILKKYGEQVKWLEVWNEYNGSFCKGPATKDRPKFYTQMLEHAYKILKEPRPDVKVIGGAVVLIPIPYFEKMFKLGALKFMDAVEIHPYRDQPEGVEMEVAELQDLIRKYNDGKDKPIWVTETGKMDKAEFDWEQGKNMHEQGRRAIASYLVRQYTLLLSQNVEKIFWYLSRDWQEFATMGLLRRDSDTMGRYSVAPAYVAYANLIRQLDGAKFVKREAERKYSGVHVYLFKRGQEEIRVCWATRPTKILLTAEEGPKTIVSLVGDERKITVVSDSTIAPRNGEEGQTMAGPGRSEIELNESPIFLLGTIGSIDVFGDAVTVLADSLEDFSKEQGKNNWFYGYFKNTGKAYTTEDFTPLELTETTWGYDWATPGIQFMKVNGSGGHPGVVEKHPVWAIRRWKSPVAAEARITGSAHGGTKGDGVEIKIFADGKELFSKHIGGTGTDPRSTEIAVPVSLNEGTLLDFAVTPGPGTDISFDATGLSLRITEEKK